MSSDAFPAPNFDAIEPAPAGDPALEEAIDGLTEPMGIDGLIHSPMLASPAQSLGTLAPTAEELATVLAGEVQSAPKPLAPLQAAGRPTAAAPPSAVPKVKGTGKLVLRIKTPAQPSVPASAPPRKAAAVRPTVALTQAATAAPPRCYAATLRSAANGAASPVCIDGETHPNVH